MKRDFIWVIVVLLALFFSPIMHDRYQTISVKDRVFIIDKTTGEGWVSIESFDLAEIGMVPLVYTFDQFDTDMHLPEETRKEKTVSWSAWIKPFK